jgi:protein phosphatase
VERPQTRLLEVPASALVVLVGASGSGKSTFATKHFTATQTLSSDRFRAIVSDDEADQSASTAAFELLHLAVRRRLERGLLTVVDSTSVTVASRAQLIAIARRAGEPAIAIVFDVPLVACIQNNATRPGRHVPDDVIASQVANVALSLHSIGAEGFSTVFVLRGLGDINGVRIARAAKPRETDLSGSTAEE